MWWKGGLEQHSARLLKFRRLGADAADADAAAAAIQKKKRADGGRWLPLRTPPHTNKQTKRQWSPD